MRIHALKALLVAIVLTASPMVAAGGTVTTPPAVPARTTADTTEPESDPESDAEGYAAREAEDGAAADFRGGDRAVLAIGGGTLTVVLLVVLLIILL